MKVALKIMSILSLCCLACQTEKTTTPSPTLAHATAEDFEEANQVSAILADGLVMNLWAPGPLLSNAVALTFDNNGVAYVSETQRRKSSDLDIRQHPDWMTEDIGLQTIEATKAFHLKKLAPEFSEQNTWLEDFNGDGIHDYQDLEVQSERIRKIWDSDEDGRADKAQLFADGFKNMETGVAAGILHHEEEIFLTVAPDVYRIKDQNKDGIADERTIISHGYGIHIAFAGHDMSGLTVGPDGRIYWSIGDIGVNVVDENGKRWAYPNQGAVMRANPDGSDFEVFAHGLRNPQEIAFDALGNLISVDNDGDHRGEHERYVHIIEGSDTGWRINWQFGKYEQPNEGYKVWMDEKLSVPHFPGQAAYLLPPLALAYDGPAGFAYNPGTALNEQWSNHFFVSYFKGSSARSKIQAFTLKSKGASFELDTEKEVIVGGIVPTGINFAPDGALYINDWKDSYAKKPAGRIWQLKATNTHPLQKETETLLKEGINQKSTEVLSQLIAHADQRIRMAAQFALVKRKEVTSLLSIATKNTNLLGRIHAIWGLGQLARKDNQVATTLLPFLNDQEENIRAQTAKVIGDAKYAPAFDQLIHLLTDDAPKPHFFAAEALGKIGNKNACLPLVNLLEKIEEEDPHLRHAIIYALSQLKQADLLANLARHTSKYVRIGAVVALRMIQSPKVANFLEDQEELVLVEAARAINDDFSIPAALPALAKALEGATIENEAFIRRAINANLRVPNPTNALRLARYAGNKYAPEAMRLDALWALGYWANPPVLDRVDNRYRKLQGHQIESAKKAISTIFPQLLAESTTFKKAIITAVGRIDFQPASKKVFQVLKNEKANTSVRIAALQTLAELKSNNLLESIKICLSAKDPHLREKAQVLLEKVDLPVPTIVAMYEKILDNNPIPEKQNALASLVTFKDNTASQLLNKWLEKIINKTLIPELHLDVLMAVDQSTFSTLKATKVAYENSLDSTNVLARFDPTLFGGNATKGQQIFNKNNAAQCLRCHALNGKGGNVGPPLDNIGNKLSREGLLLSLVDPNNQITPGYGTVILTLKDGKEIAGILIAETDLALQLKIGDKPTQTILKNTIVKRENLPSGMFDMGDVLTKAQIRDMLAFLVTLK